MAASLRVKFEEHLSCAICLEQFEEPRVLPCLHSYCHKCIVQLDRNVDEITCPECRITVKVGDPPDFSFLPSNFFAKNLIATLSLANDSDASNIKCENCDGGDCAETRCEQCNRYLCQFCTSAHKRVRDTKHHNVKTLNELKGSQTPIIAETIRCQKHQDEAIKLYCTTCQSTICRDCTIIDHRDHDFSFVGDVAQEKKEELQKLVEGVKERKEQVSAALENVVKIEENIDRRTVSTVAEINQYFGNLHKVLDTQESRFVEKANSLKEAKLKQIHAQREQLEMMLASCESNITFTEEAFNNGNDVQILNMKKYISQSLESLKSKNTTTQPCVNDDIEFVTSWTENELRDKISLCSISSGNRELKYQCAFNASKKWLVVGVVAEVEITKSGIFFNDAGQLNSEDVNAVFTGVEVKDTTVYEKRNGAQVVRFVPLEVGVLKCQIFVRGGRISPDTTLTKMVSWEWSKSGYDIDDDDDDLYIGDGVFQSGIHTWKIKLNHSTCLQTQRADFAIGVRDCNESRVENIVGLCGFVKSDCSITVKLDMSEKKLFVTPSWGRCCENIYEITSTSVSPAFKVDCSECYPVMTEVGPFVY